MKESKPGAMTIQQAREKQIHEMKALLLELILKSDEDLKQADETIEQVYKQYNIQEGEEDRLGPEIIAIIGGHINKTAELKLKLASERAKLADLLHKVASEEQQLDIAEAIAKSQMGGEMDENEGLWSHEPDMKVIQPEGDNEEEDDNQGLYDDDTDPEQFN